MLERKIIGCLEDIVGSEYVKTSEEDRVLYGYDATPFAPKTLADAVVFPSTADEVAEVVLLANQYRFPVVPRGAGSNLSGGARPIRGGVVLSTQRMAEIIEIDTDNLQARVQPGVVNRDLQLRAQQHGLFFAPDPQSLEFCTIGGNLAENAGGPRAVKYGVTRQHVLAIQAVLPTGGLARFGARTIKSVAGYDMVSLLVGSEGTLGVITEATLRLLPLPQTRSTLLVVFDKVEACARAVSKTLQAKVIPSALEFMDQNAIRCVEAYQPSGLPTGAEAILLVEVDGSNADVDESSKRVEKIMRSSQAAAVTRSTSPEHAQALWKARQAVGPSLARIGPIKVNEDVVVPLSRLAEAVSGIDAISKKYRLACACFGHVGDGNLHVNFLLNDNHPDLMERVEQAVGELFALVVSLQGSITGEHGVGTSKQPYLSLELGDVQMDAMLRVKQALDPLGVLNPGKIFPIDKPFDQGTVG